MRFQSPVVRDGHSNKKFGWLALALAFIVGFIVAYPIGYYRGENVSGLVPFTDMDWSSIGEVSGTFVRILIGLLLVTWGLYKIFKKIGGTPKYERWYNAQGLALVVIGCFLVFWPYANHTFAVFMIVGSVLIAAVASLTLKNLNKVSSANTPPATLAHHTEPDVTATAVSTTGH